MKHVREEFLNFISQAKKENFIDKHFNFIYQPEVSEFTFAIPFGPLAFALGCRVLADVFEEGMVLTEDSKSII